MRARLAAHAQACAAIGDHKGAIHAERVWTIADEVTIPEDGANGVLATIGGRYGGWALLRQDGEG